MEVIKEAKLQVAQRSNLAELLLLTLTSSFRLPWPNHPHHVELTNVCIHLCKWYLFVLKNIQNLSSVFWSYLSTTPSYLTPCLPPNFPSSIFLLITHSGMPICLRGGEGRPLGQGHFPKAEWCAFKKGPSKSSPLSSEGTVVDSFHSREIFKYITWCILNVNIKWCILKHTRCMGVHLSRWL